MNFPGFLFFLTLWAPMGAVASSSGPNVLDRVEAIVNKGVIYKSDVDQFKRLIPLRTKVDPFFAADPISKSFTKNSSPSADEIIQYLINEKLIQDKFSVNDSEVEQEVTSIQNNLRIDRESLKAAIAREGFKFEEYFQMMRASIAKRHLIDQEIRNKATVSDDDLKAEYYRTKASSKNFRGAFRIKLIRVTKKNYKTPALAKNTALEAVRQLSAGKDFKEVAQEFSDDPSSSDGGDLGYLAYGDMSQFFQKEVQKLGPGKTSGVLDDGTSWLVLRTEDVKADVDSGFEREKEGLRARLLESEFRHQVQLWLERQKAINYIKLNRPSAPAQVTGA